MYKNPDELFAPIPGLAILTADAIGADYCHDECPGVAGTPDAVAEVTSTEQAAAVVKLQV